MEFPLNDQDKQDCEIESTGITIFNSMMIT